MCFKFYFSYDGNMVTSAPSANYNHWGTSIGRLHNTPIVVGHAAPTNGNKVEALLAGRWTVLSDFPFANQLMDYSMVNFKGALYLFGKLLFFYSFVFLISQSISGGWDSTQEIDYGILNLAVKCEAVVMDDTMWTQVGTLLTTRRGHRSIVINNSIMHISGLGYISGSGYISGL